MPRPGRPLARSLAAALLLATMAAPALVGVGRASTDEESKPGLARLGGTVTDLDRFYGPGSAVGYRFVAGNGFTVTAAVGGAWAPALDEVHLALHLGLGITWRR